MPTVPESTKTSLAQKLTARARTAWPKLAGPDIRYRGQFAYVDGELADGESIKLMRLRYGGSAGTWGFALYLASTDKYEDTILPTGSLAGTPEEALDCACGLYLTALGI
ncbi:hypothetical protein [Streptomyces sp. MAR25Y5]|uniref:hypothetical protein n=1 Tax=Streptomyces sp. MAR25Y5 TaxID=2962028 RepID=UPI0020B8453F|nr:hypothetical protein [Streptomyces sp. MAR25Y5]MCP3770144.1 hypothetical protein [Streptomyces sp. MAR25Y5]